MYPKKKPPFKWERAAIWFTLGSLLTVGWWVWMEVNMPHCYTRIF